MLIIFVQPLNKKTMAIIIPDKIDNIDKTVRIHNTNRNINIFVNYN